MSTDISRWPITAMCRQHLPAVMHIDRQVYPRPWSKATYLEELSQPHNRLYLVAELPPVELQASKQHPGLSAEIAGYAGLIAVAGEGHISSIAVNPRFQNQSVGTALLLALHRAVRARQLPNGAAVGPDVSAISDMTLEVRVSNHAAQRLYSKFGYAPVGAREGYYRGRFGQGREDALVMWCHDIASVEHGERLQQVSLAAAKPENTPQDQSQPGQSKLGQSPPNRLKK